MAPPRRGCGGAGAASALARRVPHQGQPGVPEDSTLPSGAGGQSTMQLPHRPLLPCRCRDLHPATPVLSPYPSPCALLHCHRKNLLLLAILLLLHQLMHLIHISRVPGAHCGEGRSGVTHPLHDISDSNTWRTRLAARPQQKACCAQMCCGRSLHPVSKNYFTTPSSLSVIKSPWEDALRAISEARPSEECQGTVPRNGPLVSEKTWGE